MSDAVDHPNHYMLFADGVEAMDIIKASLTKEEFIGYCKGNVLKYRLRAGKKDSLEQDIKKAERYAKVLFEFLNPLAIKVTMDTQPFDPLRPMRFDKPPQVKT